MESKEILTGRWSKYYITDNERNSRIIGPLANIYVATDKSGKKVCIKSFDWSEPIANWRHFLSELTARKILSHPNILPINDYGNTRRFSDSDENSPINEAPFIVMPLCKGGSLRDVLKSRNFLSPKDYLPILKQIAYAIDFAHEKGIIHGDIKPENILFTDKNDYSLAYLADFGIASYFAVSEVITDIPGSRTSDSGGTSAYLSPEQIEDNKQSPLSDIYALGVVSYEALTGRLPFDTKVTKYKQMKAKIEGSLIKPSDVNAQLDKTLEISLMSALRTDPNERPKSALEYYRLLSGDESKISPATNKSKEKFWEKLSPAQKLALISTIITAIATVLAAIFSGIFK